MSGVYWIVGRRMQLQTQAAQEAEAARRSGK
jgi:hypothetical protein